MSREELLEAFGYGRDLQVEVDGPDARVSHLATHGISGRRRRLEERPRVQSSDEAWSREEHTHTAFELRRVCRKELGTQQAPLPPGSYGRQMCVPKEASRAGCPRK
jgi:hypothetical protein